MSTNQVDSVYVTKDNTWGKSKLIADHKPDENLKIRMEKLADCYEAEHKVPPDFIVRIPGRVNLIGEHIDYSGYPVCPMAIEQNIIIAVGRAISCGIYVTNMDPKYEKFSSSSLLNCRVEVESEKAPHWWKYFLCGLVGGLSKLTKENREINKSLGAIVWGTIPPAAGLSSSSALVISGVLAATISHEYHLSRKELVELSAESERLIGTEGGAMDHAIAFLAKKGTAKLIEFNPLRTTDVKLPKDAVFVIVDSMERHNKAQCNNYNDRVIECKLAAKIIAKINGQPWRNIETLYEIQKALDKNLQEMAILASKHLETYTLSKICNILQATVQELQNLSIKVEVDDKRLFFVSMRAQHVFEEASRVMDFQKICMALEGEDQIFRLGELMNQSHKSLKDLFDCSTQQLDEVVDLAVKCGAAGARLTGAGWGGCVIALTTKDKVYDFVAQLKEKLMKKFFLPSDYNMDSLVFQTEPGMGASLYNSNHLYSVMTKRS